ncbi:hypothetical protein E2C01_058676 [Portunus trituberculatus]|uniref:Uncharacterized protein n=1 Tax=Portunus trituberculatus TaxID=210409 RepID=A0A5B7H634_PORTR|nr:hypothetical protein [Portunus trituberculatus]
MNASILPVADDYDVAGEKGQPEDVVLVTVAVVASTIDLLFSLMLIHGVIKKGKQHNAKELRLQHKGRIQSFSSTCTLGHNEENPRKYTTKNR